MPVNKLTQFIPQPPKLVPQPDKQVTTGYRVDLTLEETAALVMLLRTTGGSPLNSVRGIFRSIQSKLPDLPNAKVVDAFPTASQYGRVDAYFQDWTDATKFEFDTQVDRLR